MVLKIPYKKVLIFVLSMVLMLALCSRLLFFKPGALEYYSSYAIYPMLVLQRSIAQPVKDYFKKRKSMHELENELVQVKQERDAALAHTVELSGIISFAQDTQEIIDFKQRYDFNYTLLAQVLLKNFTPQCHFFLLDKGSKSGVEKDMVLLHKDCIVGRVTDVYPYYSKALLITDQSCKVAAYCAQSKATGIYQGTNQEWTGLIDHVSHLCQLEIGELVLSSGDGLIFPRGFGLGTVQSFTTQGLFHQVRITPLVDVHAINYCYIVRK
jgi:rod shape-determining protein MreC